MTNIVHSAFAGVESLVQSRLLLALGVAVTVSAILCIGLWTAFRFLLAHYKTKIKLGPLELEPREGRTPDIQPVGLSRHKHSSGDVLQLSKPPAFGGHHDSLAHFDHDTFARIESQAIKEVWICCPGYSLDIDSFYEVVVGNVCRSVRYTYFVFRETPGRSEIERLVAKVKNDRRVNSDVTHLIRIVEVAPSRIAMTFVLLDPQTPQERGFVVIENDRRAPTFWVELPRNQITRVMQAYEREVAEQAPATLRREARRG